ncbi:MAG: NAD-dependent deacylase [Zoogloeaceae bacterium]|nr:NAD-dependent deacylase [Zoogloeaceae bacterium]
MDVKVEEMLDRVAEICRSARALLFVTGAGISADSGLPTYRGMGGLYERHLTPEGLSIEQALSGATWAARPELTWKYLAEIEANCRGAEPNVAHRAMAELERRHPGTVVFTQNVDGLHRRAGSRNVIEIHGCLHRLRCVECGRSRQVPDFAGLALPPQCPACQGLVRPDVVLFGEALPDRALWDFERAWSRGFDMVFSVGTTSVFPYIAAPVIWARQSGICTVEINPGETCVSDRVDFRLKARAAEVMAGLMDRLQSS